jgi:NAD(P)H-flavin reductase/ferredoxin
MAASLGLTVNGHRLAARPGQTLLDAALAAGRLIPHDCATGQCETCRVAVVAGRVEAGHGQVGDSVLACQARVIEDAGIHFEEVPEPVRLQGRVGDIAPLSPTIVGLTIRLSGALTLRPGQYLRVTFPGLPPRDYSPAPRADGSADPREIVLQIRRHAGGRVSSQIGQAIREGCRVRLEGPFGHAYHRPGRDRLVIVSGGVGWAPAWAVARESRLCEPERELHVIAGGRDPQDLYMRDSLAWLRDRGASAVLTCSGAEPPADARIGRPTDHMPALTARDTVLVAGTPGLVAAVRERAQAAGALCYADPFTPAPADVSGHSGWIGRLIQPFRRRAQISVS